MQSYEAKRDGLSILRKDTRYFLNSEERRCEKKTIKKKLNDGTETEDQEVILKEEEKFYRTF